MMPAFEYLGRRVRMADGKMIPITWKQHDAILDAIIKNKDALEKVKGDQNALECLTNTIVEKTLISYPQT